MQAFATMVLDRSSTTLAQLEGALDYQLLFGGDLGTNLVAAGALTESELHRLLADFHELPVGPAGRLDPPPTGVEELVPAAEVLLHRIYPIKRTRRTLHLAVANPLDAQAEQILRRAVGMQLRAVAVTQLRLSEALWHYYGIALPERDKRLLIKLEEGDIQPQLSPFNREQAPVSWVPPAPAYRRMSEYPRGIAASLRQPRSEWLAKEAKRSVDSERSDALDGVALSGVALSGVARSGVARSERDSAAQALEDAPSSFGTEATLSEYPPSEYPASDYPPSYPQADYASSEYPTPEHPTSDAPLPDADRDTQPYGEDGKRNTRPWAEDGEDDEQPGSLRGEFHASLIEVPSPGGGSPVVHRERRAFRHRGPFTRAQAEQCVTQATEVQVVLEILLRYARQFFERCVLFVVRGNEAQLRISNGVPRELAALRIDLTVASVFADACTSGDPIARAIDGSAAVGASALDIQLAERLGARDGRVLVVPIQIRERVVALFYGDDGAADIDPDAADDVTDFSEICAGEITRVILAKKYQDELVTPTEEASSFE